MCCCKKCGSKNIIKAGFVKGEQRYKCKECGCQFVPTRHKGKSKEVKLTAVLLYINGLSLRTIGKLFNVSGVAVLNWVRKYALQNYEKPKPAGEAVIIELDEMWHFLNLKKTNSGYGKHTAVTLENLLTGNAVIVIQKH